MLPSSYQKNKTNISLVQGEIFKISTLISRYSISLLSRETTLKKSLETACAQSPKEDFGTSLKIRTIPALQRSTSSFANNRVKKTYIRGISNCGGISNVSLRPNKSPPLSDFHLTHVTCSPCVFANQNIFFEESLIF